MVKILTWAIAVIPPIADSINIVWVDRNPLALVRGGYQKSVEYEEVSYEPPRVILGKLKGFEA